MTLSEAADALFDIGAIPDEFFVQEKGSPLRTAIVFRHLSFVAGKRAEFGTMANMPPDEAAKDWYYAPIADCLREASRIADNILRLPEADSDNA